ncbi:MAG TPA: rhodanese-like domain-containing protein [Propionibacterium sp.]|nr:rhodanese-like domain-containing protein [Propionibacterium sp.]
MAQRISLDEFIPLQEQGAVVVDVREANEYVEGHVPGATFAPMSRIALHLADIPRDEDVYVICRSGNRSQAMADLMAGQGIRAISVDDGTMGWINRGLPVHTGQEP